jgi:drug/metabolite transporter (DMT)-like permease
MLGVFCFVQISLLNHGVNLTSAAYAVVLINSHPIFTNILAHYFIPGDRLSWMRIVGLTIAFAGISCIFLGKPEARLAPHPYWGNAIAVVSAFFVGVRSIATKRAVQRIDGTRAIFWTLIISLPMFFAMAWGFETPTIAPLTWGPALAILYQGVVVAGVCFILWTRLLRDYPPGILSVFAFPTPVFGVLFSALAFSEALPATFLIGAGAVVTGILIVARQPRRAPRKAASDTRKAMKRAA